jgi:hypothetical protein
VSLSALPWLSPVQSPLALPWPWLAQSLLAPP